MTQLSTDNILKTENIECANDVINTSDINVSISKHANQEEATVKIYEKKELNIEDDTDCNKKEKFVPVSYTIEDEYIYSQIDRDILDYKIVRKHFYNQGKLSLKQAETLLKRSYELNKKDKNLLVIDKPVIIVGDIHGQYYDLLRIFEDFEIESNTFVFLGDYVDRGVFSTEVYFYLLVLKMNFPENIFLLRGNHESESMTSYFSYKRECLYKYDSYIYDLSLRCFRSHPLAAVVMGKLFCVHGGISPSFQNIDEINNVGRFKEVNSDVIMTDLLWSDPHPLYELNKIEDYAYNKNRRCSYFYGIKAIEQFLKTNNLWTVVRGHEVQENGYRIYNGENKLPAVITIFSAPNYCDAYNNFGAVMIFDGQNYEIKKYKEKKHPYVLPGFIDSINWSFPFISEKLSEFFLDILQETENTTSTLSTTSTDNKPLNQFISQIESFNTSMAIMREERECLNELIDEESEDLSCYSLSASTNDDLEYAEVKWKDIFNETTKEEDELISCVTIKAPPSVAPNITKKIDDIEIDETLERVVIVPEGKAAQKVEIQNKENNFWRSCLGFE
ncbi:Calcineurin-like phosphoesterase [Spraguea lophii 42_110]|uniref:Serine/threonine-protein phosphatase n=1 Tax=Spraguea lophii (strain 42_110) TaxID=1358809 RepID=S7WE64_SPRLO|nr:Calcineurin-like phosphoesterase [Spraguea lophii 42_110]